MRQEYEWTRTLQSEWNPLLNAFHLRRRFDFAAAPDSTAKALMKQFFNLSIEYRLMMNV